jgi:putative aminopeptidase FrvX
MGQTHLATQRQKQPQRPLAPQQKRLARQARARATAAKAGIMAGTTVTAKATTMMTEMKIEDVG